MAPTTPSLNRHAGACGAATSCEDTTSPPASQPWTSLTAWADWVHRCTSPSAAPLRLGATEPQSRGPAAAATIQDRATASKRERVFVIVYDLGTTALTQGYNSLAKDFGAFHTGVEVYGQEYWFGMVQDNVSTGVTWHAPKCNLDHTFRETLSMGYTGRSPEEVHKIIDEMSLEWMGSTYNVLTKNCHHFSNEFCRRLGVAPLPKWVNTLATTGASTVDFFDNTDSGYDGGEAIFDFFGSIATSVSNLIWRRADEPCNGPAPRLAAPSSDRAETSNWEIGFLASGRRLEIEAAQALRAQKGELVALRGEERHRELRRDIPRGWE